MQERNLILEAMENGMDIINGLHQFFSEDREFVHVAARNACPNKRHQKTAAIKRFACIHGKKIGVTSSCGRRIRYRLCLREKDHRG
jgi:uncharacterized NAD-dependent epimerase/dehydratase family protein